MQYIEKNIKILVFDENEWENLIIDIQKIKSDRKLRSTSHLIQSLISEELERIPN